MVTVTRLHTLRPAGVGSLYGSPVGIGKRSPFSARPDVRILEGSGATFLLPGTNP